MTFDICSKYVILSRLSGIPILSVAEAKNIIICNYALSLAIKVLSVRYTIPQSHLYFWRREGYDLALV